MRPQSLRAALGSLPLALLLGIGQGHALAPGPRAPEKPDAAKARLRVIGAFLAGVPIPDADAGGDAALKALVDRAKAVQAGTGGSEQEQTALGADIARLARDFDPAHPAMPPVAVARCYREHRAGQPLSCGGIGPVGGTVEAKPADRRAADAAITASAMRYAAALDSLGWTPGELAAGAPEPGAPGAALPARVALTASGTVLPASGAKVDLDASIPPAPQYLENPRGDSRPIVAAPSARNYLSDLAHGRMEGNEKKLRQIDRDRAAACRNGTAGCALLPFAATAGRVVQAAWGPIAAVGDLIKDPGQASFDMTIGAVNDDAKRLQKSQSKCAASLGASMQALSDCSGYAGTLLVAAAAWNPFTGAESAAERTALAAGRTGVDHAAVAGAEEAARAGARASKPAGVRPLAAVEKAYAAGEALTDTERAELVRAQTDRAYKMADPEKRLGVMQDIDEENSHFLRESERSIRALEEKKAAGAATEDDLAQLARREADYAALAASVEAMRLRLGQSKMNLYFQEHSGKFDVVKRETGAEANVPFAAGGSPPFFDDPSSKVFTIKLKEDTEFTMVLNQEQLDKGRLGSWVTAPETKRYSAKPQIVDRISLPDSNQVQTIVRVRVKAGTELKMGVAGPIHDANSWRTEQFYKSGDRWVGGGGHGGDMQFYVDAKANGTAHAGDLMTVIREVPIPKTQDRDLLAISNDWRKACYGESVRGPMACRRVYQKFQGLVAGHGAGASANLQEDFGRFDAFFRKSYAAEYPNGAALPALTPE